ncbi:hypothetical protein EVAR_43027_1 [Eumeta japonica]|uniref:Uncharacterized protein n=1 Tax=Eumeta variegata TaxID=151549 RepID=A0A4C1XJR0_EUMVA|nr:hypothetical protein EVAR_43027_1 [Eumeta japonica]
MGVGVSSTKLIQAFSVHSYDIAEELEIDHKTVVTYKKKLDTWVPHELTGRREELAAACAAAYVILMSTMSTGWFKVYRIELVDSAAWVGLAPGGLVNQVTGDLLKVASHLCSQCTLENFKPSYYDSKDTALLQTNGRTVDSQQQSPIGIFWYGTFPAQPDPALPAFAHHRRERKTEHIFLVTHYGRRFIHSYLPKIIPFSEQIRHSPGRIAYLTRHR